jgi:hypothetical protein
MTNEMSFLKELAVLSVVRQEWRDVAGVVLEQIRNDEFVGLYQSMDSEVEKLFVFMAETLAPFLAIHSEAEFVERFDALQKNYQETFLEQAGKPRYFADEAFEYFIPIQQSKEFNTGYPLLKQVFDRLDFLVDKYLANDSWILMSIDTLMKRLSRWLLELVEVKKTDSEDTWRLYSGIMSSAKLYVDILRIRP